MLMLGCQTMPTDESVAAAATSAADATATAGTPETVSAATATAPDLDVPPVDLWDRIRRELSWQYITNAQIERARTHFLSQPRYLPVVAERAALYQHYIVEQVQKRGMPMEIALLPMVESTLNPFAASPSRAAGLWQIMPATGKHLGLTQNWWYDGRRDLRDSTRIALDYLEALHQEFDNDWLLALAAYNSGKGRVARARAANVKKGKATDYWSLKLPRETRDYVPRLIALAQIVANPADFAVQIPTVANAPSFEVVDTGGQIELARAADLAGIELSELRAFNPGQLRWATSSEQPQTLLLPAGTGAKFSQGLAQLTDADRVQWQHYRIKRGDSLIRIAHKFDTEVGLLRQVNAIRGSRIRAGDTMMIPRGSAWASSLAMAGESAQPVARGYRVRRGDSLYRIADRFKVTINDIVTWNGLDPQRYLQPGQKLTLYVSGS